MDHNNNNNNNDINVPDIEPSEKKEMERRLSTDHNEYFNAQFGAVPTYVEPGQYICGQNMDEMLIATIGSGIAVTIHDKDLHIGGLAYLLVPDKVLTEFPNFSKMDSATLNAVFKPLDDCIGEMKRMGAGKNRIRIRVMGGTEYMNDELDRGTKNYVFVKEYLARKGLIAMSEDLAGPYIRRVHFFPATGRAVRRVLRRERDFADMKENESKYQDKFN